MINDLPLFALQVKKQFCQRVGEFEKSANWIKNHRLLALHKKFTFLPVFQVRQKDEKKRPVVLELCCGTGVVGGSFLNSARMVVGLDLSPEMLQRAKKRLSCCVNSNATRLPFKSATFDIIVCRQALHFLDLHRLVHEIKRVIRRGGRIVLSQIVPFNEKDESWLRKIHTAKQPLLKNFIRQPDVIQLLKKIGCKKIVKENFTVGESINRWLAFAPELSARAVQKVKNLFRTAPPVYKKLHRTRILNGDIIDTMNWVVASGVKK
ncbi:MAG: class I SAM-dependent methyltransferase [Planctomycetota bacterium]|mgnify:CR=1 FL=1